MRVFHSAQRRRRARRRGLLHNALIKAADDPEAPVQELPAWADDHRLIAWGCDPDKCAGKGEFHQQLLLVESGGNTCGS